MDGISNLRDIHMKYLTPKLSAYYSLVGQIHIVLLYYIAATLLFCSTQQLFKWIRIGTKLTMKLINEL